MSLNSIHAKIRALLSKTVENGCTESEYLAALDKAKTLMETYEVTEEDLVEVKQSKATFSRDADNTRDPHEVKARMAYAVAKFCGTKALKHWSRIKGGRPLSFTGLAADVELSRWLLDSISNQVLTLCASHVIKRCATENIDSRRRTLLIHSYRDGICGRLSKKLNEMAPPVTSNSRELVVTKDHLIDEKWAEMGFDIKEKKARVTSRKVDARSYYAGRDDADKVAINKAVANNASVKSLEKK